MNESLITVIRFRQRLTRTARPLKTLGTLIWIASLLSLQGTVLDNFNGAKTGWTDVLIGGGSVNQAGGTFNVVSGAGAGALAYSKKASVTFTNLANHTLEFRVNVNGIAPGAGATNGHAILGWLPTGGSLSSSGYSLSVGLQDVQIRKGATTLYSTNLDTAFFTTNLVLALRMTPSGTALDVRASVYNQISGNTNLLFEYTATDSASLIGAGGNAVLGAENRPSGAAASVPFDNLQVFDTIHSTVDNFNAARNPCIGCQGSVNNGWLDFAPGGSVSTTPGQLQLTVANAPQLFLTATYFLGQTFRITDGARIEFRVDVPMGITDPNSAVLLAYMPNGLPDLSSLSVYYIGQNSALIAAGKTASIAWVPQSPISVKNSNVRLIQTMTGEAGGTSVRLEQRIEDLDVAVNDPGRVLFQTMYVDAADAYTNKSGYFGLIVYHAADAGGDMTLLDNAAVSQTIPGNAPPIITSVAPADGKAFAAASSTISFTVIDDVNTPVGNIALTLNGVRYTNGSPGVSITGSNPNRLFTLTGQLAANVFYSGSIQATDNAGATTVMHYEFDTFLTSNLVVESEEYNFSRDFGLTGGGFIDDPQLVAIGTVTDTSYNGREGIAEIDFHDNRAVGGGANHDFRPDAPHNNRTQDGPRAKYVDAGGAVNNYLEIAVSDIANGDWLNYSHTYPAGAFQAYLRSSTYSMPFSSVTLERVLGDTINSANQTTTLLGSFVQQGDAAGDTGFDAHRNVPLADAAGNPALVRFSGGIETLRVRARFVDWPGSDVFQNYMVFLPVPDPGTLRPIVATVSPVANSTFRQSGMPEATSASIANRDTTVNTNTIVLKMNGVTVPNTVTTNAGGADVSWSLAVVPGTPVITNTLTFQDSQGTNLSYSWTYSYPFLSASNSLPPGALTVRGWDYRMVQTYNNGAALGDSLIRAEQQLAIPPEIPYDVTYSTNQQTLEWNDITGLPQYVPGLEFGGYDNIATESYGYVYLTAGVHRFYVNSDDGFQLRSGTTLKDPNGALLGVSDGDTFAGSFDFAVEAAGLYPFRCVWYEHTGGASFRLASINLSDNSTVVVNDPSDPAGVVKVYYPGTPTLVLSSPTVAGPYVTAAGAVIDIATKTATVPISGATQFYRMQGPVAVTITSLRVSGSNVIIKYQ